MMNRRLISSVFAALALLAVGCLTSCKENAEVLVKSVKVDQSAITLTEGETATISYTLEPDNATNKTVKFSSSDESVATVNDRGIVTAVSAGKATITVASPDGPQATVLVSVKAKTIAVSGVSLDKEELTITEGQTATLKATVSPDNAADKSVSWKSSNESIATVADGIVSGVKAGTAIITVTTNDGGKTASCVVTVESAVISVTGVSLDKTELTLVEGETATLKATVTPEDATDKDVTWSSSQTSVATVSDGVVIAVAPGTTAITVTTNDGNKTATCAVTVVAKTVSVSGVSLDKTELKLIEGEEATLVATVTPADASDKSVTWKSSQPSIATVDENGKVTAVKEGTAVVTVTTNDGGKTASCAVTVEKKVVDVTGVSVDIKDVTLTEGENAKITVTIEPADATDQNVTFTSSDESVATVDADGNITAVGPGTATITVTAGGKTATTTVTVNPATVPATGVKVDVSDVTLVEGGDATINVTVEPADATDPVTFTSSDESVATVDENGKITAVGPGTATITVTAGDQTATVTVTVTATPVAVTGVKLDKSEVTIGVGDEVTLVATVEPSDATNKAVTWSSNKTSIATVDENGKVTGVKAGTATITVTTADGGKKATCEVTVTTASIPVSGVSLNKTSLTLVKGSSETLVATVVPSEASNKAVTWSSSNPTVAGVDNNGKVTAESEGEATITVTTESGGFTASCDVTVTGVAVKVTGVSVVPNMITVAPGEVTTLTVTVLPSDATNKNVSWKSSKESVATVDENGKVTALTPGTATITVTTEDGGYTATCTVTVEEQSYELRSYCLEDASNYNGILNVIHFQYGTKFGSAAASSFYIVPWNSGEHALVKDTDASHFEATSSKTGAVTVSVEKISNYYAFLVKAVSDPSDSEVYSDLELKYTDVGGTSITKKVRVSIAPSKAASAFQYDLYTFDGTNVKAAGSTYTHVMSKSDASFVRLFTRYKGITTAGNVPDTEEMATYSWNSSNTSVVAITKKILEGENKAPYPELTFKAPGTSTVKYNYTDYKGNKMSKSIAFTVVANFFNSSDYVSTSASYKDNSSSKPYYPTSTTVKLNIYKSSGTAYTSDELTGITWSSNNTSAATVSGSGPSATVTIKASGVITITAKDASGVSKNFYITCFKWPKATDFIAPLSEGSGPWTSTTAFYCEHGTSFDMISYEYGVGRFTSDAAKAIKWTSSDTNIATVNPATNYETKVTMSNTNAGIACITATDSFGETRTCYVTNGFKWGTYDVVVPSMGGLKEYTTSNPYSMDKGQSKEMLAYKKASASATSGTQWGEVEAKYLKWSSSATSIATVSPAQGYKTTVTISSTNGGVVTITGTDSWGQKRTCVIATKFKWSSGDYIGASGGSKVTSETEPWYMAKGYVQTIFPCNSGGEQYTEASGAGSIKWSSKNTSMATVSPSAGATSKVTGVKAGVVEIVGTDDYGNTRSFWVMIYDLQGNSTPYKVATSEKSGSITHQMTKGVDYTVLPDTYEFAGPSYLKWTSSNTSVATVNSGTGLVTIPNSTTIGETVITGTKDAGFGTVTATRKIQRVGWGMKCIYAWDQVSDKSAKEGDKFTAYDNDVIYIDADSGIRVRFYADGSDLTGNYYTVVSNSNTSAVKWVETSSDGYDRAYVFIESNSTSNTGTSTITIKYDSPDYYVQKTFKVTIIDAFKWGTNDVAVPSGGGTAEYTSSNPYSKASGKSFTMYAWNKSGGTNYTSDSSKKIKWTSSDTSIATVSPEYSNAPTVTMSSTNKGVACITGTDSYGNKRTCYVTNGYYVNGSSFCVSSSNPWVVSKGGTYTLKVYLPNGTEVTSTNTRWSSSNTSIATVSASTGASVTLTGVAPGETTIKAKVDNQGDEVVFYVMVYEVSSDSTPFRVASLKRSGSITHQMTNGVDYTIKPATFMKSMTWSSSNTSVATVNGSGLVTIPFSENSSSATITGSFKDIQGNTRTVTRTIKRGTSWSFKCIQSTVASGCSVGQTFNNWDSNVITVTGGDGNNMRFRMSCDDNELTGNYYTITKDSGTGSFSIGTGNTSGDYTSGYYVYITLQGKGTSTFTVTYSNSDYYVTKTFKVTYQ